MAEILALGNLFDAAESLLCTVCNGDIFRSENYAAMESESFTETLLLLLLFKPVNYYYYYYYRRREKDISIRVKSNSPSL